MIKVLHIGYSHRYDDIRVYVKECESLAGHGYDVTYITSDKNSESEIPQDSDVHRVVVKLSSRRGIRGINYIKKLKRYLKETTYDIYHIHEFDLFPIARYLIKHGKKVIYDMHEDAPKDTEPFIKSKFGIFSRLVMKYVKYIDNSLIKNASYNVIVVPGQEARVVSLNKKTRMICNYPIIRRNIISKISNNNICYAGGISENRGITQLVEAMPKINGRLLLAGDCAPDYLNYLKTLEGWSKVEYLGYIDRDAILKMYSNSSIGVFIAEPLPNTLVSYPIKIFEYMEAELPVVCSDYKGWVDVVEGNNCGKCVSYGSQNELIETINGILANEIMETKLGENGRQAVINKYSWQSQERKLLELYEELSIDIDK